MTNKEFIKNLGFNQEGKETNLGYEIEFKNSNEYSKAYSILDKAENIDLDIENINISEHSSTMLYLSDEYDIVLQANFDDDKYKIIVKEAN